MVYRIKIPDVQFSPFDLPLLATFRRAGTTLRVPSFMDAEMTIENPEPVCSDQEGQFHNIWLPDSDIDLSIWNRDHVLLMEKRGG